MCHATEFEILAARQFHDKQYHLSRCNACGQHVCLPPPSPAEIASFYEGDYHGQLRKPGASEAEFGTKFARYRDWVLQFLQGGRSLDIGTATGLFPSMLKAAGFDAEGLEYNAASAAWGQEHYGIRIRTCDLPETGEHPQSFSLISMTDVLEHTAVPVDYLRMVREYLRPGGYALITFPDIQSFESRYQRFLSRASGRDWLWGCCHIPLHVWEFTPDTAKAMFHKAGFEVAGFRRSHLVDSEPPSSLAVRFLFSPVRLLDISLLGRMLGTQMEFMIRNRS